jgi:hypothetical protein
LPSPGIAESSSAVPLLPSTSLPVPSGRRSRDALTENQGDPDTPRPPGSLYLKNHENFRATINGESRWPRRGLLYIHPSVLRTVGVVSSFSFPVVLTTYYVLFAQQHSAVRTREAQPTDDARWSGNVGHHRGILGCHLLAYGRAPYSPGCCICGEQCYGEHHCPYNYTYGLYYRWTCRGECSTVPEKHRITSQTHRMFLRCVVRVNSMPPRFRLQGLRDLFSPFGPLQMWDVIKLNVGCICRSIFLSFGVVVFENHEDGLRAIDELNGYESGGRKFRVDCLYPSCA